jgi:hypothetical protein
MQMNSLRIYLAILISVICLQQELGYASAEEISYPLLDLDIRQIGDAKAVSYSISIDRFLDRPQIEQLICQVLRKEKPAFSSMLSVLIFFGTDHYMPGGLPSLDTERAEHTIAIYNWSIDLPDRPKRLMVRRDGQGNFLDPPQFYDFDHAKACKQDADQGKTEIEGKSATGSPQRGPQRGRTDRNGCIPKGSAENPPNFRP